MYICRVWDPSQRLEQNFLLLEFLIASPYLITAPTQDLEDEVEQGN
jgi:hypothetical protein